ncbi:hypothetical protein ACHAXT_012027 [Thalassiosira profunda]
MQTGRWPPTAMRLAIAIGLGAAPAAAFAFVPPAATRSAILYAGSAADEEPFDPFLQSPHSFGGASRDAAADSNPGADEDFDPLLSPHAYVNGADAAPETSVSTLSVEMSSSSTFGFLSYESNRGDDDATASSAEVDLDFDPLLSPHAYAKGIAADPVGDAGQSSVVATQKLGILLIDHGSRRQASNEHIHNVAQLYEGILNKKKGSAERYDTTIVRAAHMEIATPSISDSLRNIIAVDQVSKVVCVPYFLSPGRHATEDVPNLIEEAREILAGEGFSDTEVVVSNALGTHLEGMLGAVDHLVERCLEDIEG